MAEVIVYQAIHTYSKPQILFPPVSKKRNVSRLKYAACIFAIIGFFLLFMPYFTTFAFSGAQTSNEASITFETKPLPSIDPTLPILPYVKIPEIGVDAQIYQYPLNRHEEALKKGIWMPLDSDTPLGNQPVILAAHRFGYLSWTNTYRRENSFYNFHKLKEGNKVEVVWQQRKFTYEIYKTEKNTKISDSEADLILYTCNDLISDIRIFVYANRVG